jgi:hypothetical protein
MHTKYLEKDKHRSFIQDLIQNKLLNRKEKVLNLSAYIRKFGSKFNSHVDYWASKKVQHDLILELYQSFHYLCDGVIVFNDVNNHYYLHNSKSKKTYGLTEIMLNDGSNLGEWLTSAGMDVLGYDVERYLGTGWNNTFTSYNYLGDLYCHFEVMNRGFGMNASYSSHDDFYDHLIQMRQLGIGFLNESSFDESMHDLLLFGKTMFNLLELRPWRTTLDNYIEEYDRNPSDEDRWYSIHFLDETIDTLRLFREAREHLLPTEAVEYFGKEINKLYHEAVMKRMPEPEYDDYDL